MMSGFDELKKQDIADVLAWIAGNAPMPLEGALRTFVAESIVRPCCATCRWAKAQTSLVGNDLQCTRVDEVASLMNLESPVDGGLFVQPTFGCVQWEAKP